MRISPASAAAVLILGAASAAQAQDVNSVAQAGPPIQQSVFSGDYLLVGAGAVYSSTYDGSDDYKVSAVPVLQGSFRGVGINARAGGLSLDFINDASGAPVTFAFGPSARIRSSRDGDTKDDVVELLADLDTAIEVGPSGGIGFAGVLHEYDRLSINADMRWDVAGAHDGMTISPSVSYITPLSRGTIAIASIGAEYADDDFMDYYFSVTPEASAITGLPAYEADGGLRSAGGTLLLGFDANGELADGGLAFFVLGSYSRMLEDAKRTPFTSIRGSADQWMGAVGAAYTF